MKHYFQAEQLKYRHTSVAAITLGMPMFTALLAFWLTSSYFSVDVYNWWYIGLYPGFLGILCSIIGKKDKQKKNYTIWSLPCGMEQIWDAKILVGIKMSADCDYTVCIPMSHGVDSLNVAAASAVAFWQLGRNNCTIKH